MEGQRWYARLKIDLDITIKWVNLGYKKANITNILFFQSGIVAGGIGKKFIHYLNSIFDSHNFVDCGESSTPGIYVDVGKFRNWIDQQMSSRGLQTQSYTV